MKYGASSSIIILDYDVEKNKFRVTRRIEVPKSEYSYDNAVNLIVDLNRIYNPSWIYVDRGAGKQKNCRLRTKLLKFLNYKRAISVKAKFFF